MNEEEKDVDSAGILYLVATPIGNLKDLSQRALDTLRSVDFIAAEDTRHSGRLLVHFGINKPLVSLHEHNEDAAFEALLDRIDSGQSAALVSDAGTPLISDPGYPLVRSAVARGIRVSPVPGPCALVAALSASGLPTDRFRFEGFPPRNSAARRKLLESLTAERATLVFYESSHRITDFCADIEVVFPGDRPVTLARELTKLHETITQITAAQLTAHLREAPYADKGEFVVMIAGSREEADRHPLSDDQIHVLKLLLEECSVRTAVTLACRITGARRDLVYPKALELQAAAKADG